MHLLTVIEEDRLGSDLSDWLSLAAELIGRLHAALTCYRDSMRTRVDDTVGIPEPVTEIHTGLRGRPRKVVDVGILEEAISTSRQIHTTELARVLGIHRNTLCSYMKSHGIERRYTKITDMELDNLVTAFKKRRPDVTHQRCCGHGYS
ncbi:hypothetical protein M404DRAFT_25188 [Pisolithus tinctorius Marx 270]|uniref:DNA binding HTH domain-containing protein n=1 Tax=Pisolithus tinctorius Marx 270 TaxID=870435 RepID=A0A0C3PDR7_PISTI|nr:hypothetical protein M404DRAFT_25188 [Pisolithus tinctorius Marx 270]